MLKVHYDSVNLYSKEERGRECVFVCEGERERERCIGIYTRELLPLLAWIACLWFQCYIQQLTFINPHPPPTHRQNKIYILAPPILNTISCPQEKPMICKQLKIQVKHFLVVITYFLLLIRNFLKGLYNWKYMYLKYLA